MIKGLATEKSSRVHYIIAGLYLLWTSSALGFIDTMVYGHWLGKSGSKITEAINLLGIATSLTLFWWGTRSGRPQLNLTLPIAVVTINICSVLWSVAPGTTLTRSIAYLFLVVGAIGLVKTLGANEIMELTASIFGLLAAVSLLLLVVLPSGGDFSGVFTQKNTLGQAMAIGILAGLHGVRTGRRKLRHTGVIAICAVVGVLSKSTTALLAVFAFFVLHIIGSLYVRGGARRFISSFLMFILALAIIFVIVNKDMLFGFLNKDPTLTGRTELWPYVNAAIMQRPLFGWGFTAFWSPLNQYSVEISTLFLWGPDEAHNGLLQVLLDVGMIGTAFYLLMWMRNLVMAMKCMNGPAPEIGLTSLLLLVGILLIGVTEQVLVVVDEQTTLFFLLGFMSEQALRSRRPRTPRPPGHRSAKTVGLSH